MKGDPQPTSRNIENVEIVFQGRCRYDTQKLLDSAKGHYGEF